MDAKKKLNRESDDEISRLFKMMLMMVEDMKQDHDFHYEKLYENIPNEYHAVINTAKSLHSPKSELDQEKNFKMSETNQLEIWGLPLIIIL